MTSDTDATVHAIAKAVAKELAEILGTQRPSSATPEAPKPRAPHPQRPLPDGVSDDDARRFWDKVEVGPPDACWPWKGTLSGYGYGIFNYQGRRVLAHRFAYTIAVGPIPEGLCLLHSCDTRACANTNHLRPGTQTENMADKIKRGRHLKGTQMPNAKLDEAKVAHIRSSPDSNAALARLYGVSPSLISDIRLGHKWRDTTTPLAPARGRGAGGEGESE